MIASMRLLYQIPVAYCKLPDRDENSEAVRKVEKRPILSRLRAKISFFISAHDQALSGAAVCVSNPDRSPFTIQSRKVAMGRSTEYSKPFAAWICSLRSVQSPSASPQ
jgi:hypothetical protein